ncbi:FAD-binding oxidoreductase [Chloroflexota bacterium]
MNKRIIKQLERITGKDGVLKSPEDLAVYGYDGTFMDHCPDIVVLPRSTQQVSELVTLASSERIPVVPRGMGSGLTAASIPSLGGMVLSMTRMNKILEIDEDNWTAHVQAGVITSDLQESVEKLGFYYPPDPSSNRHSTIGGNIACNAGGPRCLKYGVTGDYVLGLKVVLADGRVIRTGGKSIKDVAGYDLNALFTGSEGTLGVITEAILRLIAKPVHFQTATVEFPLIEDASNAVNAILKEGIIPAALELIDETAISCIDEAMQLGLPLDVEAILLVETDGSDAISPLGEIKKAMKICMDHGARNYSIAKNKEERVILWQARNSISPALARRAPNKLGEDITVPRSAIPEAIRGLKEISAMHGLPIVIFGHAGDGNLHPNILFDKRDAGQSSIVEKMAKEIFSLAMELGGSLSGEHGIGTLKLPYMKQALGWASIDFQKSIKRAADPFNILNPGKVFPE